MRSGSVSAMACQPLREPARGEVMAELPAPGAEAQHAQDPAGPQPSAQDQQDAQRAHALRTSMRARNCRQAGAATELDRLVAASEAQTQSCARPRLAVAS